MQIPNLGAIDLFALLYQSDMIYETQCQAAAMKVVTA